MKIDDLTRILMVSHTAGAEGGTRLGPERETRAAMQPARGCSAASTLAESDPRAGSAPMHNAAGYRTV